MLAVTPSRTAGYLDAIEKLAPLAEAHRASFDRDRRLPDEVFRALAEAGLFRLWLPATMGGPELSPTEFMQVVEAASALDGSIGWIVANGGGISRVAGYLPPSVAREWFADPGAFIVAATGAVGTAHPMAGGYRVTGTLAVRQRQQPCHPLHRTCCRQQQPRRGADLLLLSARAGDHSRHLACLRPSRHREVAISR